MDESGVSLRENLEQVKRQTGRTPPELETPRFPILLEPIWSAFISLSNSRNPSMSGVSPITFEQIKAWSDLTGNVLKPFDVELIKKLDLLYMRIMNG